MNAALMQAELGKLPIWSGDSSKDGYTIEQWSDRVDRAAETANWDDRDTMNFVYNAFRGPALKWLEALKTFGIDDKSWVAVKAELLEAYSRVQTARTTVVQVKSDFAHAHATVAEIQPHTQPQGHDAALDAKIEALSASFQALLKRRNGNNSSRGGRGNGNSQRGRGGRGRGGRGGNTTGYNVCRYCKKPGHLQKVCNSRIKAGAPEVDAQGKPYTNATELEEGGPTDGAAGSLDYSNPWLQQPAPYDYGAAEEIYQDRPDFI